MLNIKNPEELAKLASYINHFNTQYDLLIKRYEHLKEIDEPLEDNLDIGTYFDIVIVQLRAIFIENPKYSNNYTLQNIMKKIGKEEYAQELDDILSEEFLPEVAGLTIRDAIKFLADKFICHYDSSEGENSSNYGVALTIESRLRNPHSEVNLYTIMSRITTIVEKGINEVVNELSK